MFQSMLLLEVPEPKYQIDNLDQHAKNTAISFDGSEVLRLCLVLVGDLLRHVGCQVPVQDGKQPMSHSEEEETDPPPKN